MMINDIRFLHEQLSQDLSRVLDKNIVILGCGAIGANLAISLARRGFRKFWLVDDDRIERHNLSTQPWSEPDLKRLKVQVLSEQLFTKTGALGYPLAKRITSPKQIAGWVPDADILVDAFDNAAGRAIAQELSKKYPVVHLGMSTQGTAEVVWDRFYTLPPDVPLADPCNYPLSRTLIELTVAAGAQSVIQFLLTGRRRSYFIRADDLLIKEILQEPKG